MDPELQELVKKVLANPHCLEGGSITDAQVEQLAEHIGPYSHVPKVEHESEVRTAIFSYTNLREEYLQNLTMTSLVGYIFRAHYEHKIPAEDRRWSPAKKRKSDVPFSVEDLLKHANAIQSIAERLKAAEESHAQAQAALEEYREKEMVFSESELAAGYTSGSKVPIVGSVVGDKFARYHDLETQAATRLDGLWGVRYALTLLLRNFGIEAERRIVTTEREAKKFPQTASIIEKAPDRFGGILPAGQQEVPEKLVKKLIHDFLANQFEYNPDAHVRKAHDQAILKSEKTGDVDGLEGKQWIDPFDPDRIPIEALVAAPPVSTVPEDSGPLQVAQKSQHWYNTVCCLLTNPELARAAPHILANAERFRRLLLPKGVQAVHTHMPPADIFYKWRRYQRENYDSLRATTNSLFCLKPCLDFMLVIYDVNSGTRKEVTQRWNEFKDKYQDEVMTEIHSMDIGGWTVLTDRMENTEKMDLMNRGTSLISRILESKEKDMKIGKHLLNKRVLKAKAKNIAEAGPDDPGLAAYQSTQTPKDQMPLLDAKQRKRLEAARGNIEAQHDLDYFEEHDATVKRLESEARYRELTDGEREELQFALAQRKQAEENLLVPDGALQVDVNVVTTDEDGNQMMTKKTIYTQADGMEPIEHGVPDAPFDDTRPLAPFARKLLDKEIKEQRSDAEKMT